MCSVHSLSLSRAVSRGLGNSSGTRSSSPVVVAHSRGGGGADSMAKKEPTFYGGVCVKCVCVPTWNGECNFGN